MDTMLLMRIKRVYRGSKQAARYQQSTAPQVSEYQHLPPAAAIKACCWDVWRNLQLAGSPVHATANDALADQAPRRWTESAALYSQHKGRGVSNFSNAGAALANQGRPIPLSLLDDPLSHAAMSALTHLLSARHPSPQVMMGFISTVLHTVPASPPQYCAGVCAMASTVNSAS